MTLAERISTAQARARKLDPMNARRMCALNLLSEAEVALRRAERLTAEAEQELGGDTPMTETRGGTAVR